MPGPGNLRRQTLNLVLQSQPGDSLGSSADWSCDYPFTYLSEKSWSNHMIDVVSQLYGMRQLAGL